MKVCPKGGGFDTKMLDFHLRIFGFQSLSPQFYHHLVEPSAIQDILEVREGPQVHTVLSPVLPPCSLHRRDAPMVLPQVLLCGLSAEGRLVCEPKKPNNLFNF